jgi:hypothetical protein
MQAVKPAFFYLLPGLLPAYTYKTAKRRLGLRFNTLLLRRGGSNSRPSGYEPDELPLLYFAMWAAKIKISPFATKLFLMIYLCSDFF